MFLKPLRLWIPASSVMTLMLLKLLVAGLILAGPAQAALHDRGGGLLYDDVLNVTWLQDANYTKTSGYDPDGKLNWYDARKWVEDLVYHDPVRNVDLRGWRLPRVNPVKGQALNGKFSLDGSTDEAYNITSPRSELAYMFNVNLGLKSYYAPSGEIRADFGLTSNGRKKASPNQGLARNVLVGVYWTGTAAEPYPDRNAWMYDPLWGYQNFYNKNDPLYAWPVRDGDVTSLQISVVVQRGPSHLHDRGGGLLYDDVLDVTWLQDANYAKTSGFHATGKMSFAEANKWAQNLVYHDPVRNVDLRGWRLPRVRPAGSEFNHQFRYDGTTDEGYNITSPHAELSYMFYVNLGLQGWRLKDGTHPLSVGVLGRDKAAWKGQRDVGLVKNFQSFVYWCGSGTAPYKAKDGWVFVSCEGNQRDGFGPRHEGAFAWAVRDGDVAAPTRK